jgi:hypothetical protein
MPVAEGEIGFVQELPRPSDGRAAIFDLAGSQADLKAAGFKENNIDHETQTRRVAIDGSSNMQVVKIVVWKEDDAWIGYLQDYPDYWTRGDSLDELREHLKDLYADLSAGLIPGARRVEDLVVS